jgi:hypothetical protein
LFMYIQSEEPLCLRLGWVFVLSVVGIRSQRSRILRLASGGKKKKKTGFVIWSAWNREAGGWSRGPK